MNEYWEQKKRMAPGCEPEAVTQLMTHLRPHTLGMSLAGAGGGGFLYVLFRETKTLPEVELLLKQVCFSIFMQLKQVLKVIDI